MESIVIIPTTVTAPSLTPLPTTTEIDTIGAFPIVSCADRSPLEVLDRTSWSKLPSGERDYLTTHGCAPLQQYDFGGCLMSVGVWFGTLILDINEWAAALRIECPPVPFAWASVDLKSAHIRLGADWDRTAVIARWLLHEPVAALGQAIERGQIKQLRACAGLS